MKSRGLFGLLLLVAFSSCKYRYQDEVITVNKEFSITIIDYLKKVDDLKPNAEFQYSNKFRNFYVVAFSDKKSKPLVDYDAEQVMVLKDALLKPMVSDSENVSVSGLKGIRTELYGKMQDENIYYSHLTLESENKYYQICIWTRGEDRKLKYKEDIEKILLSFKLLKES